MRNNLGQFVSGHSGNAGGRPKDEHKVAELARSYTTEANGRSGPARQRLGQSEGGSGH